MTLSFTEVGLLGESSDGSDKLKNIRLGIIQVERTTVCNTSCRGIILHQALESTEEIDAKVSKLRDDMGIRQIATSSELCADYFAHLLQAKPLHWKIADDRKLNIALSIDEIGRTSISRSDIRCVQRETTSDVGWARHLSCLTSIERNRQLWIAYTRHEDM